MGSLMGIRFGPCSSSLPLDLSSTLSFSSLWYCCYHLHRHYCGRHGPTTSSAFNMLMWLLLSLSPQNAMGVKMICMINIFEEIPWLSNFSLHNFLNFATPTSGYIHMSLDLRYCHNMPHSSSDFKSFLFISCNLWTCYRMKGEGGMKDLVTGLVWYLRWLYLYLCKFFQSVSFSQWYKGRTLLDQTTSGALEWSQLQWDIYFFTL